MKTDCTQLQATFYNKPVTIQMEDNFYTINQQQIGIVERGYRQTTTNIISIEEFERISGLFKTALSISEPLAQNFYAENREEIEPLFSEELDHYKVAIDLLSYTVNSNNTNNPSIQFDISIECRDKDDQPIFMYDTRGFCTISFETDNAGTLLVKEVS